MESPPPDGRRDETDTERFDRNWDELLQELRVTQTGVQLLAGFLLTLPFQQRFATITETQRNAYLIALTTAVLATALLVAPVSAHRLMFRRHAKGELVRFADVAARTGLLTLAVAISAATFLIFDVVLGRGAALTATAAAVIIFVVSWLLIPLLVRRQLNDE